MGNKAIVERARTKPYMVEKKTKTSCTRDGDGWFLGHKKKRSKDRDKESVTPQTQLLWMECGISAKGPSLITDAKGACKKKIQKNRGVGGKKKFRKEGG